MDAMAFGMGMCCLQVTHQAKNLQEAMYLNDHLACVTPVLMALTACTPFFRGKVADVDCRWTVISQSVDDRTPIELGKIDINEDDLKLSSDTITTTNTNTNTTTTTATTKTKQQRIYKSRYDTIDSFLSRKDDFKVTLKIFNLFIFVFLCLVLHRDKFVKDRLVIVGMTE